MFYKLNDNVFIVCGANKHAIYDLNTLRLYHIDSNGYCFIQKLLKYNIQDFSKTELEMLNNLIDNAIITQTDKITEEKQIKKELKQTIRPTFAWIEITQKCNLKCVFCYEESSCQINKMMAMDDFRKAINFLVKYGIKNIQFIGGEPMLHPNLKEMIGECIEEFDFIEVYTNGTYITQEWCDFFKKNDIHIALSLHSFIPEEYEKITQVKGSFALVKNALDLILKNKLRYRLAAIKNKNVNIGKPPKEYDNITLIAKSPKVTGRGNISQFNFNMFKESLITQSSFSQPLNKEFVIRAVNGH